MTAKRLRIPEDLRAAVERAERVGQAIYRQDRASAYGTDVMLARVQAPHEAKIGAYLSLSLDDAWNVYFLNAENPAELRCQVRLPGRAGQHPVFELFDRPRPAPEGMLRIIRARFAAVAALGRPQQPQNPVLLPATVIGREVILVYLIAGSVRPRVAVLGKHHRVVVSSDGNTVESFEPLSKSFLEIPLESGIPEGSTGCGLGVTHLVTDYPLETHVFVSLLHGVPLSVVTSRGSWIIEDGKIALLAPPS